jgi:hypothetical protein
VNDAGIPGFREIRMIILMSALNVKVLIGTNHVKSIETKKVLSTEFPPREINGPGWDKVFVSLLKILTNDLKCGC